MERKAKKERDKLEGNMFQREELSLDRLFALLGRRERPAEKPY